ncbi:hypothetical protein Ancab_008676 [Ancistrocladus abbreviatus]
MEKQAAAIKERAHVLVVPFPATGHLNPMLQFGKCLASKGVKCTLVTTVFVSKTYMQMDSAAASSSSIEIDTISDGYDETGCLGAETVEAYMERSTAVGSKTLSELITRHSTTPNPVTCVIYDAMTPWVLDVTEKHGLIAAAFSVFSCAVTSIFYHACHGQLSLFPSSPSSVSFPGLPLLDNEDLPTLLPPEEPPTLLQSLVELHASLDKADFVLLNTIYEWEEEVVDSISIQRPVLTIGPTIPYVYLDNQVGDDKFYGLDLYKPDNEITTKWLEDKPPNSVVYVSFGSVCSLGEEQMMELAWALKASTCHYLWVISSSLQAKLPKDIFTEIGEKGIVVNWSPQLEVLANKAIGCHLTHCGWNSTLEGLCLGVPMVAMPQCLDHMTTAKFIQDVWKIGKKVKRDEKGFVTRQEIMTHIVEVMHGEQAEEMRANAKRLSCLAKAAISEGGSSHKNINKFVDELTKF